jgi:hypothetical protein
MKKIVYQTDTSGRLLGETEADQSPLEPGVWLLPGRTVEIPPPPKEEWPEGMWPRWVGTRWEFTGLGRSNTPAPGNTPTALAKLQAFLSSNPDVAALLDLGTATA